MNNLFLDSANLEEIRSLSLTSAIDGFTTNPSLTAKEEKRPYKDHLLDIAKILEESYPLIVPRHLSVEVITADPEKMVAAALDLRALLNPFMVDLAIKIPVALSTLSVITELESQHDVRVNATACMTADQAKMAMDAGASYVSFFYNRMLDGGLNANLELNRFATFRSNVNMEDSVKVICGSIRKPEDVLRCWENGADIVTAPYKIIHNMSYHPKTEEAIIKFQTDIEEWLK